MTKPQHNRKEPVTNMAEDIFNPDGATPPVNESFLEQYVGEGKKFKNVNDLAKAYANADKFIPELKNDLQTPASSLLKSLRRLRNSVRHRLLYRTKRRGQLTLLLWLLLMTTAKT
jgi:hypothetical protein